MSRLNDHSRYLIRGHGLKDDSCIDTQAIRHLHTPESYAYAELVSDFSNDDMTSEEPSRWSYSPGKFEASVVPKIAAPFQTENPSGKKVGPFPGITTFDGHAYATNGN
ncbi:MAG: hypothetical protein AAGM67_05580, partial [Bacteroidota bacterium]